MPYVEALKEPVDMTGVVTVVASFLVCHDVDERDHRAEHDRRGQHRDDRHHSDAPRRARAFLNLVQRSHTVPPFGGPLLTSQMPGTSWQ